MDTMGTVQDYLFSPTDGPRAKKKDPDPPDAGSVVLASLSPLEFRGGGGRMEVATETCVFFSNNGY